MADLLTLFKKGKNHRLFNLRVHWFLKKNLNGDTSKIYDIKLLLFRYYFLNDI